ncbi:hypothetical protein TA3x_003687 [Tundrisphaera sp. TA3]|uniref:hypothetical protein n=1 Tax=Tundrisphaera sp. TA3 TaxID=3435775 RepID=UPI003EB95937
MPCSPAKIEANRRNAARSTGPKTEEGKAICRRAALKHGLTGRGIVLPVEDEAAVAGKFAAYERELKAEGEVGRDLARRAAVMAVRLDRAAEHEAAMLARKIRVAEEVHDEERRTYVDELADDLREAPATVVRRLKAVPEGVDWLVAAWNGIKADLQDPARVRWNGGHWHRIENLMGRRPGAIPAHEVEPLVHACWGSLGALAEHEGAGLDPDARQAWARDRLAEWIDAQVAALEALRPGLPLDRIAADRADAGRRALFDPSPQATLARKYEAAAERGLYRALKELKAMQEVGAAEAEAPAVDPAAVGPNFPGPDGLPEADLPAPSARHRRPDPGPSARPGAKSRPDRRPPDARREGRRPEWGAGGVPGGGRPLRI